MTILTVKIDNEKDLPELEAFLNRSGLAYQIEEDGWGNLPETVITTINAGLEDVEAGRVFTHEYVMTGLEKKLHSFGPTMAIRNLRWTERAATDAEKLFDYLLNEWG